MTIHLLTSIRNAPPRVMALSLVGTHVRVEISDLSDLNRGFADQFPTRELKRFTMIKGNKLEGAWMTLTSDGSIVRIEVICPTRLEVLHYTMRKTEFAQLLTNVAVDRNSPWAQPLSDRSEKHRDN